MSLSKLESLGTKVSKSLRDLETKVSKLVFYMGRNFYFEPNGRRCYLYLSKKNIGRPEMAVFAPSVSSVRFIKHGVSIQVGSPLNPLRRSSSDVAHQLQRIDHQLELLSDK